MFNPGANEIIVGSLTATRLGLPPERLRPGNSVWVDDREWDILVEKILIEYYDVVYKQTSTESISTIDSTDLDKALEEIKSILKTRKQK